MATATDGGVLGVIRASRPLFRSPHDRVAFAVQSAFLSAGYSLVAAGSRAASDLPEGQESEEVGIEGWNDMEGAYAFLYSGAGQEVLCKSLLMKCLSMGDALMVDVVDNGSDKEPVHLEIKSSDYVTSSEGPNYGHMYKNLPELVQRINSSLLSELPAPTRSTSTSKRGCEYLKDFDQEDLEERDLGSRDLKIIEGRPPTTPGMVFPAVLPIGGSDLLPGPGAGVFPNRVDPAFGGGMLLGPNDPRWGVGIGDDGSAEFLDGGRGVPPGARFDPFGPPGVPGFEPNRFPRNHRPPGRDIHPDLQHFQRF